MKSKNASDKEMKQKPFIHNTIDVHKVFVFLIIKMNNVVSHNLFHNQEN